MGYGKRLKISQPFMPINRFMAGCVGARAALGAFVLAYIARRFVPDDYWQRRTVKIMFVHAPAAWMALFGYFFCRLGHRFGVLPSARHGGARCCTGRRGVYAIALVTVISSPWCTWWFRDARLTSGSVLFSSIQFYRAMAGN